MPADAMRIMHDLASPHTANIIRYVQNNTFNEYIHTASIMKKALFYLVIFVAVQAFAYIAVLAVGKMAGWDGFGVEGGGTGGRGQMSANGLVFASLLGCIILLGIFLKTGWCKWRFSFLLAKGSMAATYGWTLAAVVGSILPSAWLQELTGMETEGSMEGLVEMLKSGWSLLAVCLLVPLTEEVVFRGGILGTLMNEMRHRWTAILVSAVMFGAAHFNLAQMPHAVLMGVFLGWLCVRTGNVGVGVWAHVVNNSMIYAIISLMPGGKEMTLSQLMKGNETAFYIAIFLSAILSVFSVWKLNNIMRTAEQPAN